MYYVLGNTGFIGRNISTLMANNGYRVIDISRPHFDITNPKSYNAIKLRDDDTIIDCIAKIDGQKEEVFAANYIGLSRFVDYLNQQKCSYHYFLFSSYSTLLPEYRASNHYIESKYRAEKFVKSNCDSFKIIRLIFPFGIGENKNRLISRLISKIIAKEKVIIDNFETNLTPISALMNDLYGIFNSKKNEINYSTGYVYHLEEVIIYLYNRLDLIKNYSLSGKRLRLIVNSDIKTTSSRDLVFEELNRMTYDQ